MEPTPNPLAPALDPIRAQVIQQLCEHFAVDHISAEMLEERLDRAHTAGTPDALQSLVSDLPALRAPMPPAGMPGAEHRYAVARADYVPERQVIAAVMGGASRKGPWTPPSTLTVVAVMGGAELDFRQAHFGPGVTTVNVFAFWGGVEITVPPGVRVETNSLAIMGAVEEKSYGHPEPPYDPNAPVLRIGGVVIMGGVEVKVKPWTPKKPKVDWEEMQGLSTHALRAFDPYHRRELKKELRKLTRSWDD